MLSYAFAHHSLWSQAVTQIYGIIKALSFWVFLPYLRKALIVTFSNKVVVIIQGPNSGMGREIVTASRATSNFFFSITQRDIAVIKIVSIKCRFCVSATCLKPPDTIKGRHREIRPGGVSTPAERDKRLPIMEPYDPQGCFCLSVLPQSKKQSKPTQEIKHHFTFFEFAESALNVFFFFLVTPYRLPIIVDMYRWTGRKWRRT